MISQLKTYAFLDNGGVVSLMLTITASVLGIVIGENPKHKELQKRNNGTKSVTYTNVNLSINGMNSHQTFDMEDVQVSADIEFSQINLAWSRKVCEKH